MKKRPIFNELRLRFEEPRKFIQVLLGPRQVGKTTLATQVGKAVSMPIHYITADTAALEDLAWLQVNWETARQLITQKQEALLIIDEVQKIPHWSAVIKKLWDEDTRKKIPLKVMILGSSPWLMQKGLSESLAGRFEILPITHWSYPEMQKSFGLDLDEYIYFGGYPGSAHLIDSKDPQRWRNYINDSLIETTLSRDIILMTQVNKPALLRRLFQMGCLYSGQILSFQKMLGQLQDAGNTTTLAHYLDLLTGVGLVAGLQKYANQHVRKKGSSPKLHVFNTALISAQSSLTIKEAKEDRSYWSRLVESAVGAFLLNSIRGTLVDLHYWREGENEVDFVLKKGSSLTAIEVKTSDTWENRKGMDRFIKAFQPQRTLLIGGNGIPLERFFKQSVDDWV